MGKADDKSRFNLKKDQTTIAYSCHHKHEKHGRSVMYKSNRQKEKKQNDSTKT